MVTHNPNLVVNTDADQVVVAMAAKQARGLPTVMYFSGSLEDRRIRQSVVTSSKVERTHLENASVAIRCADRIPAKCWAMCDGERRKTLLTPYEWTQLDRQRTY
jgi:hypothetical protein